MQTLDAIKTRHSCRSFESTPVTPAELGALLAAANAAPVGMAANDSVRLSVLMGDEILGKIRTANPERGDMTYGAPLLILVSAKSNDKVPGIEYANASCIIENILIEATDLDLESIYLWGYFEYAMPNQSDVMEMLDLPAGFRPIAAAAVGHGTPASTGDHPGFETDTI